MSAARVLLLVGLPLALPLFSGCTLMRNLVTQPAPEPPVSKAEGYLAKDKDPNELGPDERLLLAEFSDTQAAKLALETQLAEARATIDALQSQLHTTEEVRDRERTGRAAAEAELTRLRTTLQDRETKILTLHLEKAKVTQDLLLLKIEAAESRADVASAAARSLDPSAGPPPGGQR